VTSRGREGSRDYYCPKEIDQRLEKGTVQIMT
jgi:hypothetical protein